MAIKMDPVYVYKCGNEKPKLVTVKNELVHIIKMPYINLVIFIAKEQIAQNTALVKFTEGRHVWNTTNRARMHQLNVRVDPDWILLKSKAYWNLKYPKVTSASFTHLSSYPQH